MTDNEIIRVLEAALLCAAQPMSLAEMRKMFVSPELSVEDARRFLAVLQLDWRDRGLELTQVAGGWRFQSRASMQPFLSRLTLERPPKYSRAVLETLAIIAWRQPVTRGDIEDIRGVSVSSQIIRALEDRGWIETLGFRDAPGRPALLGTTRQFLTDLGLRSLDELPDIDSEESADLFRALPEDVQEELRQQQALPTQAEIPLVSVKGELAELGLGEETTRVERIASDADVPLSAEPHRDIKIQE